MQFLAIEHKYKEAARRAYEAADIQSDVEAEYRSEVSAFGDAWAGAHGEILNGRARLAQAEADVKALREKLDWLLPKVKRKQNRRFDEVPF